MILILCQICYSHAHHQPNTEERISSEYFWCQDSNLHTLSAATASLFPVFSHLAQQCHSQQQQLLFEERGKQKKTKLKRRRSKSRSYTLLCLAKSWLKAPERESSRKKNPTNDSSFFIFQEGLTNYDNCQTKEKQKPLEFYCKLHLVEMWSLKVEESLASCTTTTWWCNVDVLKL